VVLDCSFFHILQTSFGAFFVGGGGGAISQSGGGHGGGVGVFMLPDLVDEDVKEVFRVLWATHELRVKLDRGDGLLGVDEPLVGAIVDIAKVGLPRGRQSRLVDRVAVILGGDDALACHKVQGRLVVATVAMFELVRGRAGGKPKEKVAHADPKHRRGVLLGDQLPEVVNSGSTPGRVAWAVGDEDAVKEVRFGDVVVPREKVNLGPALGERADDVVLDPAVDQAYDEVSALVEHLHGFGGHLGNQVLLI